MKIAVVGRVVLQSPISCALSIMIRAAKGRDPKCDQPVGAWVLLNSSASSFSSASESEVFSSFPP